MYFCQYQEEQKLNLNYIKIKYNQLIEKIKIKGINNTIKEVFFLNKTAITFHKKLKDYQIDSELLSNIESKIISISSLDCVVQYSFPNKSRYLKLVANIKQGYEVFLYVLKDEVVGDCWFATSIDTSKKLLHPDIKLFRINPAKKSAYMFDMFVKPEERGTQITNSILKYAFYCFKQRGITDVYSYVMSNNIPAIWTVRTLGFKELKKLKMNYLLFYKSTSEYK